MAIRVLIVDDSGFFRHRIEEILRGESRIEVIGSATNGKEAVEKAKQLKPDVITMDVEMPQLNGIDAVRIIMRECPTNVLMLSSLTHEGARITLQALEAGAADYFPKDIRAWMDKSQGVKTELVSRIIALGASRRFRSGSIFEHRHPASKAKEGKEMVFRPESTPESTRDYSRTSSSSSGATSRSSSTSTTTAAGSAIERLRALRAQMNTNTDSAADNRSIMSRSSSSSLSSSTSGSLSSTSSRSDSRFARSSTTSQPLSATNTSSVLSKPVVQPRYAGSETSDGSATVKGPGRVSSPDCRLVVIGSSTGGPAALQEILTKIPANFPYPILLVQHMPKTFTSVFAERLNQQCKIAVKEAEDGDKLVPGRALLAPGGLQMIIDSKQSDRIRILEGDTSLTYKPSVDVTYASAARAFRSRVLAVILTGMGADGCDGAKLLKREGAVIWAQSKDTCTIYGMPQAVVNAGLASEILNLEDIGPSIANTRR